MKWKELGEFLEKTKVYFWFMGVLAISISGFAQALALSSIDTFYIRFFSVTQLVSDAVAGFSWSVMVLMLILVTEEIVSTSKNKTKLEKISVYSMLILILSAMLFFTHVIISLIAILILIFIFPMSIFVFKYVKDNKYNEKNIYIISFVIIVLVAINFTYINILIPKNFENASSVCKEKKSKKCQIKYFNDKYIFAEIGKDDNKKIKVLKFDKFFEN